MTFIKSFIKKLQISTLKSLFYQDIKLEHNSKYMLPVMYSLTLHELRKSQMFLSRLGRLTNIGNTGLLTSNILTFK
jgi:hypothetical protein